MAPLEPTIRIVEEFLLRREERPELDLAAFVEDVGEIPDAARRAIERWLKLEVTLGSLQNSGGDEFATRDEEPDALLGTTLGGFEIRGLLGRGGTGTVYLATRTKDGRSVALKLLHPVLVAEASQRERFRREASMLARLDHPHIARLIEAGEAEGCVFHAIELIEGESLDRVLQKRRHEGATGPDALTIIRLGIALAGALHHAHGHGLIHRDLKPGNVILGENGHPWLIDFGLARDLARSRVTVSGHLVGTPVYMAPEQLNPSLGAVDARTDVFGLGLLLAEFATGVAPKLDVRWQEQLRSAVARRLPRDLGTVLLRALEAEPRRRYADAAELRDELERTSRGDAVRARRPGILRRVRESVLRHPVVAAALGVLLLATGVVGSLLVHQSSRDAEAAREHLLAAEQAIGRDDFLAAEAEISRARALGAKSAEVGARLQYRKDCKAAAESLDAARAVIFDPRAGTAALDDAEARCVAAASVLRGAETFDSWVLRAMICFRRRDLRAVEAALDAAALSRGLVIPADLRSSARSLGLRMLLAAGRSGTVGVIRPGDAVLAADLDLMKLLEEIAGDASAESPEMALIIGSVYYGVELHQEAARWFDRVLAKSPAHPSALWMKAQCYLRRGDLNAAYEMARLAEAKTGGGLAAKYVLGVVAFERQEYEDAIAAFAEVEAKNPAHGAATRYRGEALARLGRHEEAEGAFDRLILLTPLVGDAYSLRGTARFKLKRYEDALVDLDAAGRLDAQDASGVVLTKAACYAQLGRAAEALAAADSALALNRSLPWGWWWRSKALQLLDRPEESAREARTAARLALRLEIPEPEARALADDAAKKEATVKESDDTPPSAESLQTLLDAELPWLLLDATDIARRLRLLAVLGDGGQPEPVLTLLRASFGAAASFAQNPPSGIPPARARREMGTAVRRLVQNIRSSRSFEVIRALPGVVDLIQEGLDLSASLN